MNETLINNFNSKLSSNDNVYILGDVAFLPPKELHKVLGNLNGHKFLIYGNHDKVIRKQDFQKYFVWRGDYKEIKIEGQKIVLMHYALRTWNRQHYYAWNLYGHSHNSLPELPHLLSMDVGVDAHNFSPVSFEEIKEKMDKKKELIIQNKLEFGDHHKPETR